MLSYQPTTINPAAVLGASLISFRIEAQSQALLSVSRTAPRSDKLEGHFFAADTALAHDIRDNTALLHHMRSGFGTNNSAYFEKMTYDDILQMAAKLHAAGFRTTDPLLYEQVELALTNRPVQAYTQAYQDFLVVADDLLAKVQALNLQVLAKTKGIRTTVTPRKARALTCGAAGVHLYPDLYQEQYVNVQLIGMGEGELRLIRDLAFDVFERAHLRPYVRII